METRFVLKAFFAGDILTCDNNDWFQGSANVNADSLNTT